MRKLELSSEFLSRRSSRPNVVGQTRGKSACRLVSLECELRI